MNTIRTSITRTGYANGLSTIDNHMANLDTTATNASKRPNHNFKPIIPPFGFPTNNPLNSNYVQSENTKNHNITKSNDDYINQLATKMANDMMKSPQDAIDRGAVNKEGRVEKPNRLEPAVQEELKKFLKEFSKESEKISNKINKLNEDLKEKSEFKKSYEKFVDKYNNNFKGKTDKDLFDKGFNAKDVVDSFDKAYDEAKKLNDKSVLDRMDDIKKDVDKYIRPMDNLARGDQGTAIIARDNMKKSLQNKDGAIEKLKNSNFANPELKSSLENLSNELDKPLYADRNLNGVKEELSQAAEKIKSGLSDNDKAEFEELFNRIDSESNVYNQMDKITYAGATEEDGKAVLDTKDLGFDPKDAATGYFQNMHDYHKDEIRPNLERMNELAPDVDSEERNIDYDSEEIDSLERETSTFQTKNDIVEPDDIFDEEED